MSNQSTSKESVLPPIIELAKAIRDGETTVDEICTEYGVTSGTLSGRFSIAGFSLQTGEKVAKRGGDHKPLESANYGAGGQYVGGGDWANGLPTSARPAQHRIKPKATGFDWNQAREQYVARGGVIDDSVWPVHKGKVVTIGGEGLSRHRIHTWEETDPDDYNPERPLATGTAAKAKRTNAVIEQAQISRVCLRYRSGASIRELADAYGVSITSIRTALRNGGEPTRSRAVANRMRAGSNR